MFAFVYYRASTARLGLGFIMRWAWDTVQRWRGGTLYPWRTGKLPSGAKTPTKKLDLQPGELVRIRSCQEDTWRRLMRTAPTVACGLILKWSPFAVTCIEYAAV